MNLSELVNKFPSNISRMYLFIYLFIHSFISVIPELIAVIMFPVKYNEELNGAEWYVGWSYVAAVLSAILVLIAAILLLIDRGADESLIREKTCYYNDESIEETLE